MFFFCLGSSEKVTPLIGHTCSPVCLLHSVRTPADPSSGFACFNCRLMIGSSADLPHPAHGAASLWSHFLPVERSCLYSRPTVAEGEPTNEPHVAIPCRRKKGQGCKILPDWQAHPRCGAISLQTSQSCFPMAIIYTRTCALVHTIVVRELPQCCRPPGAILVGPLRS